jgi:hypothetical protein
MNDVRDSHMMSILFNKSQSERDHIFGKCNRNVEMYVIYFVLFFIDHCIVFSFIYLVSPNLS